MHRYSFEKLDVWQKSRDLTKLVYSMTPSFPASEKFGLVSQLQRACISVSSNIAEGTARKSYKEKARFTEVAYGSLMEVLNQLILSNDLSFISKEQENEARTLIDEIGNKLNRLRQSQLNNFKQLNG